MAKVRKGRRSGASGKYFQFPLCLITATEDRAELVQLITAHTAVTKGSEHADKLTAKYGPSALENMEAWERQELEAQRRLTFQHFLPDYDGRDWRHRAVLAACADEENDGLGLDMRPGAAGGLVKRYERAAAHVERHRQATGETKPPLEVRIAADLLWGHLNPPKGRMTLRRFRVLAAVYAVLGSARAKPISYRRLIHAAAGFQSVPAYERAAGTAPGEASGGGYRLPDASTLPERPGGGQPLKQNVFRYDNARAYWQANAPEGVPFVGPEGMFTVSLTRQGFCFRLRRGFMPEDGNLTTGRVDPAEHFEPGMEVLYCRRVRAGYGWGYELAVGNVKRAAGYSLHITASDTGVVEKVTRGHANPAPVELLDLVADNLPAAAAPLVPELLTLDQLRYDLDKLEGWFVRLRPSPRSAVWFSNSLSRDELAVYLEERFEKQEKHKHERQLAELDVRTRRAEMKRRLAEELAERKRQAAAAEEAARLAAEAARPVPPPAADGRSPAVPPEPPLSAPRASRENPASVPPLIETSLTEAPPRTPSDKIPSPAARARACDGGEGEGQGSFGGDGAESPLAPPSRDGAEGLREGLFGPPALPARPSPPQQATDAGATASGTEPALPEDGAEVPAETGNEAGAAAGGEPAEEELPGAERQREPERPARPPVGALTAFEALARMEELCDTGASHGPGGRFRQVVTADGRAWYVERDASEVEQERAALAADAARGVA